MKIIKRRKTSSTVCLMISLTFRRSPRRDLMRTDIRKVGDNYQIEVELPGFSKEDIKINLDNGYLTISARREHARDEQGDDETIIRSERYFGEISRSYYVGDVSEDDISAKYNNGILTVLLPAESKAEKKKYITIE